MTHAEKKMKQIDQIIVDNNESYEIISETRTKNLSKSENNSLNDSQEEIIEETIIYEVPSSPSQNSCGEDKSSSDEEDKSDSDKSESEVCETICEIMQYEGSCNSNQDDQETICEIVTYEITEKKVKTKSSEAVCETVVRVVENEVMNEETVSVEMFVSNDVEENVEDHDHFDEDTSSKSINFEKQSEENSVS